MTQHATTKLPCRLINHIHFQHDSEARERNPSPQTGIRPNLIGPERDSEKKPLEKIDVERIHGIYV